MQLFRNFGAAIIINFCTTNRQTKMFSKRGIEVLTNIIRRSVDSPDVVAQQTFLVHITKRNLDLSFLVHLMIKTETMIVKTVPSDDEKKWIQLANKVIHHKQVILKNNNNNSNDNAMLYLQINEIIDD